MLDVHAIADDPKAIPILSWTIRDVRTNLPVGHVVIENGSHISVASDGHRRAHESLREAMGYIAEMLRKPTLH